MLVFGGLSPAKSFPEDMELLMQYAKEILAQLMAIPFFCGHYIFHVKNKV